MYLFLMEVIVVAEEKKGVVIHEEDRCWRLRRTKGHDAS